MRIAWCVLMLLFQSVLFESRCCLWAQEPAPTYKAIEVVRHATYEKVLDIVFQHDEANRACDLMLRYEPSNAPELEICIRRMPQKTQVVEYTAVSGSVYAKLNSILQNGGKEDASEMAKQIQVRKRVLDVQPAQADRWWSRLPDAVGATIKLLQQRSNEFLRGVGTITIDGTHYSFWHNQVGGKVLLELTDHETSSRQVTGQFELVRWMNTVRRDVERLR